MVRIASVTLLLILALAILLIAKGSKFSWRQNTQFWLVGGYVLLLLVVPGLIKLLPVENQSHVQIRALSEGEVDEEMLARGELYQQAIRGRPEQARGVLTLARWEFPQPQGNITTIVEKHLNRNGDQETGVPIIVERKDQADGLLEVVNYSTRTIINGYDFTDIISSQEVTWDDDVMMIAGPAPRRVDLAVFNREFAAAQILGKDPAALEHGGRDFHRMVSGEQLLYLRLPAHIELQSDTPVIFANE